jgi:catechol 2,3-dioxygenase-like lactoylglutathione lyase family enzyme
MDTSDPPRIQFVYSYSTELAATRLFYGELLGLPITVDTEAFIEFSAGVKLVFLRNGAGAVAAPEFSSMPGWPETGGVRALCSIRYGAADYRTCIERLVASGVRCRTPDPVWRDGCWELAVLDPSGNTVELFCVDSGGTGKHWNELSSQETQATDG